MSGSVGASSGGLSGSGRSERARVKFDATEVATVLSRYDLGVVHSAREVKRGSGRSPKILLKTERGAFVLKKRAPGRDEPARIRLTHTIQRLLAKRGFPLPRLVGTRDRETLVIMESGAYELFEYIEGEAYDQSLPSTEQAGRALALFHMLLADFDEASAPTGSSYHANPGVQSYLAHIPERSEGEELGEISRLLRERYAEAAQRAAACGIEGFPLQVVHGDWHPGNLLYGGARVVGVIDYDTVRLGPRIVDVANGVLQFSVTRSEGDPEGWPEYLDEARVHRFVRGYDSVEGCVMSKSELRAIPWLMIEALIAEAAVPIATTGTFAGIQGGAFLQMVGRKVRWLDEKADEIVRALS